MFKTREMAKTLPTKTDIAGDQPVRRGLSLLELLVVLTILIALGGIVVATLPGMLRRTQVATAAANIPEIDATIRRQAMLSQGSIGNRFDSLVSGSSASGGVPNYIAGSDTFTAGSLSKIEIEALNQIGVTELVPATGDTDNATFGSHDQLPIEIGNDTRVCMLTPEAAETLLVSDWNFQPIPDAKYIVFGLGEHSSIVGAGPQAAFSETPVHFSDAPGQSPKEMYSRYLLLVEIKTTDESIAIARYVGTGLPGRNGIHSVSKELESYYSQ